MIGPLTDRLAIWWAHARGRSYGSSMLTSTGRDFYPLDPDPREIEIADIARGLANECRYAGQTSCDLEPRQIFYSVAEHSVILSIVIEQYVLEVDTPLEPTVRAMLAREWAREALLHDASEAYLGDMIRPLKYHPRMAWFRRAEGRLQRTIYDRFGLRPTSTSIACIKEIDNRVLVDELQVRKDLLEGLQGNRLERYLDQHGEPLGVNIIALPPAQAEFLYTSRFVELWPEEVLS